MSARPRLGFIGLGLMGAAMTRRLLGRGWQVTVWNLEPERLSEVARQGALWADTPAAVRAASDIVLVCVLGDEAIESICFGQDGLASARGADVVVDFSTTSVDVTRDVAERLDVRWLDCPISGGPGPAEAGELALMAGGDPTLFDRLRPILDDLSSNCTLMGPPGAGQTTKVLNQAIVGVNYVLLGEILAMAQASGIDADKLPLALKGGAADSVLLQRIFPVMLNREFEPPKGRAGQLGKDLRAVADFNATLGLDLPVVARAIDQYVAYVDAGNGDKESASVSRLYDRRDRS
jgi:3-hydroxyisobutyrate dehydrogenase